MPTNINTHLGKNIQWIVYRNGHNELRLVFTKDGDPYDITDLEFKVYFRSPGGDSNKLTLSEADELDKDGAGGILIIPLTSADINADLKRDRYFVLAEYTLDEKVYPLIQGYVIISKETNPGTTTTSVTIPVNTSGFTVNMEVTLGSVGSIDIGNLTDEQLQQLATDLAPYII